MSDSSHDSSSVTATDAETNSVPSSTFFEEIKFNKCGTVSEKVRYTIQAMGQSMHSYMRVKGFHI